MWLQISVPEILEQLIKKEKKRRDGTLNTHVGVRRDVGAVMWTLKVGQFYNVELDSQGKIMGMINRYVQG